MIGVQCIHSINVTVIDALPRGRIGIWMGTNLARIARTNHDRKQYAEVKFDTGECCAILQTLCLPVQVGV